MFVLVVIYNGTRTNYATEDAAREARAYLCRHGVECYVARA